MSRRPLQFRSNLSRNRRLRGLMPSAEVLELRQVLSATFDVSASPAELGRPNAGEQGEMSTLTVSSMPDGYTGAFFIYLGGTPVRNVDYEVYQGSVSPNNKIVSGDPMFYSVPAKIIIVALGGEGGKNDKPMRITALVQGPVAPANFVPGEAGILLRPVGAVSPPSPLKPPNTPNDRGEACPKPSAMAKTPAPGIIAPPSVMGKGRVDVSNGAATSDPITLFSAGFGKEWALASDWSSVSAYSAGSTLGRGFVNIFQPSVQRPAPDQYRVVGSATRVSEQRYAYTDSIGVAHYKTDWGSELQRLNVQPTAANGTPGLFEQVDEYGNVIRFYDFSPSIPVAQQGKFKEFEDAYGNKVSAVYDSAGQLTDEIRNDGNAFETFHFDYETTGLNKGLMIGATLSRVVGGNSVVVRKAKFVYYNGSEPYGRAGDLKFEQVLAPDGRVIDTNYYRYYTEDSDTGFKDGMKFIFHADAYDRLVANRNTSGSNPFDPSTLSDEQVRPFADNYYEYDIYHRVTKAVNQGAGCSCAGSDGSGAFTYSYQTAPASSVADINNWRSRTIETLPDGHQEYYYFNYAGELMLDAFVDKDSGKVWATSYRYDAQGRLVQTAQPSAVSITSLATAETYPDLVGLASGTYQYLLPYSGLIQVAVYGQGTSATDTTPGDAEGYLSANKVQQGYKGTAITTDSYQYYKHVDQRSVGATTYPVARVTLYPNQDTTGARTTKYTYGWYTNGTTATSRIQAILVEEPTVSAARNGPDTADASMTVYDTYGRPTWVRDADNFIHYTAYDNATGAVIRTIDDVNTVNFTSLPAGWITRPGGGLNLVTTFVPDALGRPAMEVDAKGAITYWVYDDVKHEVQTYRGWDPNAGTTTGPIEVTRHDRGYGYVDTYTMTATLNRSGTSGTFAPTGYQAIGSILTLTRDQYDLGGRLSETDSYYAIPGTSYPDSGTVGLDPTNNYKQQRWGSPGTNYYATTYGYDHRGRLARVVDAVGTITGTEYDSLGRATTTKVGTVDGYGSTAGQTPNMTVVASYKYDEFDDGQIGDGNLTTATAKPGAGTDRVTRYAYDWRDRLVAVKGGEQGEVSGPATDTVNRQITYMDLNNLGEVTAISRYDGDGITPSSGTKPSGDRLRAWTVNSLDDQGRVYAQRVYSVDPSNGAATTYLDANYFRDHRGNLVASFAPGGMATKVRFDGAGRVVDVAGTDGAAGMSWAAAQSLAGDHVLTETRTRYDGIGAPIQVTTLERHHDDTSTGPLAGSDAATIPDVYVSDLPFTGEIKGYTNNTAAERDHSVGGAGDHDGGTLTLGSTTYVKGLGVHATSDLHIDLGGLYSRFQAFVGIDAEAGTNGSVVFSVYGDDVLLATVSAHGGEAPKPIDVNVAGRGILRLLVTDGGDGLNSDHADWADAKLTVAKPVYVSDLPFYSQSNGFGNTAAERDHSVGGPNLGDGGPIRLGPSPYVNYTKGLGVHANSDITISLDGLYSRFQASVGVDAEAGSNGTVVFYVFDGDTNDILATVPAHGGEAPKLIDVNVAGRKKLRLAVSNGGDNYDYDHADWADARLTIAKPVYVSDLPQSLITESKGYDGTYAAERDHSVGGAGDNDGGPIRLGPSPYVTYTKGLGVHANSEIRINLGGLYSRFQSYVGIDAEAGTNGSVVFQVFADNGTDYTHPLATISAVGGQGPQFIDVDVAGRGTLVLRVSGGTDVNYDHADWADAKLLIDLPTPARTSTTAAYYDAAGRLTDVVDVGTYGGAAYVRPGNAPVLADRSDSVHVTSYRYNAAGWVDQVIDPRSIVSRTSYDALGRATQVVSAYADGVVAAGEKSSDNTVRYTYDGLDRVKTAVAVTDAIDSVTQTNKLQTTTYNYGVVGSTASNTITSNDLLGSVVQPDNSTASYTYNLLGQVIGMADANGTAHEYAYDVMGRLTSDSIKTLGAGVDGAVRRLETAYDSAGRAYLFTSYDAPTGGNVVNQVLRTFNGFGQLVSEAQEHAGVVTPSSPKVQYTYTGASGQNNSRLVSMTYPNGRVLNYTYSGIDAAISRPTSIAETIGGTPATLESYGYLGLGTVVERAQPQAGVKLTYVRQAGDANAKADGGDIYTGLDRFGRIIDQNWVRTAAGAGVGGGAAGSSTVRLQYVYDRDGNATSRHDLVNSALDELYAYDNLNRLTSMKRGPLTASTTGGPLDTISSPTHQQAWTLDALGNWGSVTTDGTSTVTRDFDASNQATRVDGQATPAYTPNGNASSKNGTAYKYDAWNRLVSVGGTAFSYAYDALGRRIVEKVGSNPTDVYFTPDWQAIEERSVVSGSTKVTQYVLGVTGQVVLRDTTTLANSINGSERRFAQQNANGDTMATVFLAALQELYRYDAYGAVRVYDPNGNERLGGSRSMFRALFQGGRYDYNTGLYLFQHRDLDPADGSWMERDPLGLAAGDMNVRRFVGNNPVNWIDPSGLQLPNPTYPVPAWFTLSNPDQTLVLIGPPHVGDPNDPHNNVRPFFRQKGVKDKDIINYQNLDDLQDQLDKWKKNSQGRYDVVAWNHGRPGAIGVRYSPGREGASLDDAPSKKNLKRFSDTLRDLNPYNLYITGCSTFAKADGSGKKQSLPFFKYLQDQMPYDTFIWGTIGGNTTNPPFYSDDPYELHTEPGGQMQYPVSPELPKPK